MRVSLAPIRVLCSVFALSLLAACSGAGQPSLGQTTTVLPGTQQSLSAGVGTDVSPDKCPKRTGGVKILPCRITFNNGSSQQVTVSAPGSSFKSYTEGPDTCSGIVTFTYFDYGIFTAKPAKTKGTCRATFTAYTASHKVIGTAKLAVTNNY
jgi:hypothetical protein